MINLDNIKPYIKNISLNNLLSILSYHNIKTLNIRLVPIFANTASNSTILDIYTKNENIYIEINIFKIKIFSHLENNYQYYTQNNYINSIDCMKSGLKSLLYRYVFGSNLYQILTKKNIYLRTFSYNLTIDNMINNLYKLFAEDYVTIITYNKNLNIVSTKPSYTGKAYLNDIYLGSYIKFDTYTIDMNFIFISESARVRSINSIKEKIEFFKKNIYNIHIKINIKYNSIEESKGLLDYVGKLKLG